VGVGSGFFRCQLISVYGVTPVGNGIVFLIVDSARKTMKKLAEFGGGALVIYLGRCGGNKSIRVWPDSLCLRLYMRMK
jgi:hypothetical protein